MDNFDNAFNSLGTLMVGPVARTVVVVVVVLVVRVVVVMVGGGGHFRGFVFFAGPDTGVSTLTFLEGPVILGASRGARGPP